MLSRKASSAGIFPVAINVKARQHNQSYNTCLLARFVNVKTSTLTGTKPWCLLFLQACWQTDMRAVVSPTRWATVALSLRNALYLPRVTTIAQTVQQQALLPAHPCAEFSEQVDGEDILLSLPPSTQAPSWTASDCIDVWAAWTRTLPASLRLPYPDRKMLRQSAADMRRRGESFTDKIGSRSSGEEGGVVGFHILNVPSGGFPESVNVYPPQFRSIPQKTTSKNWNWTGGKTCIQDPGHVEIGLRS